MRYSTDLGSQRGPALEKFSELSSIHEEMTRSKLDFHEKFQQTRAYQMLSPMRRYQPGRLEFLEEACWRFRCAAAGKALRGTSAGRALVLLLRLKQELGEPIWLSENVAIAFDTLQDSLQHWASRRRQGRPRDNLGQTFRRLMRTFFRDGVLLKTGWRSLSQPEMDEILNDLFRISIGRALSLDSYIRMRKRRSRALLIRSARLR
jgi:hypothetical protein